MKNNYKRIYRRKPFLDINEAAKMVRTLGLTSEREWVSFTRTKTGSEWIIENNIPRYPYQTYGKKDFEKVGGWVGFLNYTFRDRWEPEDVLREFMQGKTQAEYDKKRRESNLKLPTYAKLKEIYGKTFKEIKTGVKKGDEKYTLNDIKRVIAGKNISGYKKYREWARNTNFCIVPEKKFEKEWVSWYDFLGKPKKI